FSNKSSIYLNFHVKNSWICPKDNTDNFFIIRIQTYVANYLFTRNYELHTHFFRELLRKRNDTFSIQKSKSIIGFKTRKIILQTKIIKAERKSLFWQFTISDLEVIKEFDINVCQKLLVRQNR